MKPLTGEYYVKCNEVFRNSTDQARLMLNEVDRYSVDRSKLRILSVGAGAGLFEIPMLEILGDKVESFAGVDVNEHACRLLIEKLERKFSGSLEYEVANEAFQDFQTGQRFEIVLFNHTFEYLDGDRLSWVQKSRDLLSDDGNVLIFSPNRGGINKFYGEVFAPCFSEDLARLLDTVGMQHTTTRIDGQLDVSLLTGDRQNPDRIRLLSFLTQIDCRGASDSELSGFVRYFLSLRNGDTSMVHHPTTLFVL